MCDAARVNGVPMCKTHDRKLVDRKTLESLNIKREHPQWELLLSCFKSFTFNLDVNDFLTPR